MQTSATEGGKNNADHESEPAQVWPEHCAQTDRLAGRNMGAGYGRRR
jgi:hypothetical protein